LCFKFSEARVTDYSLDRIGGGLPSSTGPAFWPWNVSIVFANESFKGQKVLSQHPNLDLAVGD
jgi:hypothetical protein